MIHILHFISLAHRAIPLSSFLNVGFILPYASLVDKALHLVLYKLSTHHKHFFSVVHWRSTVQRTSKFKGSLDHAHLWRRLNHFILKRSWVSLASLHRVYCQIATIVFGMEKWNLNYVVICGLSDFWNLAERTFCCWYSHWRGEYHIMEDVWPWQDYLLDSFLWYFI